jgi:hypothetical protein
MPDMGIQPPYLDPSQYPAYLDLQKKQMLAQALGQAAQQTSQTPAEWNSMRVVPKKSALSTVAALATALGAGKMQHDAFGAQQQYMRGLFGGQPSAAPTAASSAAPKSGVAPLTSEMPPQSGVMASQPQSPQSPPPAGNQNMLLTGDPKTSQALLSMMGPQEYAKALAGRYAPTDMEKMLRAAGIDPSSAQGQQALVQNVNKQNYIAPVQAREGSTLVGPDGKPTFYNPKVAAGAMPQFGANGMPNSVTEIPGAAGAAEDAARAQELGQTAGKYSILPTGGGGSAVVGGPINQGKPSAFGRPAPRVGQFSSQPPAPPGLEGMPKLPVSTAIGAPDAFTEGTLKASGAKHAELASQYGKEADIADQKLQYNGEAAKALQFAEVGPASDWLTEHRSLLKEWGVPDTLVPGSGSVSPTIELNKFLKNTALQGARQIYGKGLTNMDVKLQTEEMSPSPTMTREAITSLLHQDNIKQMYAKQRADDYGRYIENKGDPMRFESWYSKTHPLTGFAKQHAADPTTSPSVAPPQTAASVTKQIGGKTYIQQNGKWFEQ